MLPSCNYRILYVFSFFFLYFCDHNITKLCQCLTVLFSYFHNINIVVSDTKTCRHTALFHQAA
ncbi:hypothetical protein CLOSYM_00615 [[Clostridium] symbiosum ATCC 14940]|uniref:Secreted protein n=1 Tax=[Clostridium] symbiosum ATCC 14940 TaxID=411472 RepID=A0ABC9U2F9_CLOSY|nr:hypothetical protein CLOSYM_00615 [[Clostridium] symbiosum ATCC 14940]